MQNIHAICVCGAGTMGSGITQVAAQNGFKVIQYDVSDAMLQRSKSSIEISLSALVQKQKITEENAAVALKNIHYTNDITTCTADVVIEAIIENQEAKMQLFKSLSNINKDTTIFATNTSSISITAIAGDESFASRVVGMHFFNPAPLMKLVEVIKAKQTDATVVETICLLAKRMNKVPVVCSDSPGFIVNRVARHYYLEAMKIVEAGETDFKTIDTVMESSGFKMGPFKLMDLIGLDINYTVSDIVWHGLGKPERLKPSELQKSKVEKEELGKKSGKGFYEY